MIETLPLLIPDPQRCERTVARCHDRLARRRRRMVCAARSTTAYLAVERVLVGGLCVVYLSGVAFVAIQMLAGG